MSSFRLSTAIPLTAPVVSVNFQWNFKRKQSQWMNKWLKYGNISTKYKIDHFIRFIPIVLRHMQSFPYYLLMGNATVVSGIHNLNKMTNFFKCHAFHMKLLVSWNIFHWKINITNCFVHFLHKQINDYSLAKVNHAFFNSKNLSWVCLFLCVVICIQLKYNNNHHTILLFSERKYT